MYKSILLICVLILNGCVVTGPKKFYSGPDRPAEELSGIECGNSVLIKAIDGAEVDDKRKFCKLSVLPGVHTVTYQYFKRANSLGDHLIDLKLHKIKFTAKKGHTYRIAASYPEGKYLLWLIEYDVSGNATQNDVKYIVVK